MFLRLSPSGGNGCPGATLGLRTPHDVLNFGDRDAARNQFSHERQVANALAALVPFDLGLQRFDDLVTALLVGDVGQGDTLQIKERGKNAGARRVVSALQVPPAHDAATE